MPRFEVPAVRIQSPKDPEHGDYATPICLQVARMAGAPAQALAQKLVNVMEFPEFVQGADVAGPGYVNFQLSSQWVREEIRVILRNPTTYGSIELGRGRRVQVEFISANPTGSLNIGSGRNAVLGDTIAGLLQAAGYEVEREYYINDLGTQVDLFGEAVYVRYLQVLGREEQLPEGCYPAEEIATWAQEIAAEIDDKYVNTAREDAIRAFRDLGVEKALAAIRHDCERLGIKFDRWFSQKSLYDVGISEVAMSLLEKGGHVYSQDNAVWFNAEKLGCSKDEVLIRSSGEPTYFASDIAYHYDKFMKRSFDWVINVWGADHHGHVPRMKAMMRALGLDPDRLTLLIYQLVKLKRSGEAVKMSKRQGTGVSLAEVLDEVGPDAFRFFLLTRSADAHMELDLGLAKEQTEENPVVYVQYAHARAVGIMRNAREQGLFEETNEDADLSLLTHPSEMTLIRKLVQLPVVIEEAAERLAPHQLVPYVHELAAIFNGFYRDCRVVSDDPSGLPVSRARLCLVSASKTVLARVLAILGITAPERI